LVKKPSRREGRLDELIYTADTEPTYSHRKVIRQVFEPRDVKERTISSSLLFFFFDVTLSAPFCVDSDYFLGALA
jgi:hypothetical protein